MERAGKGAEHRLRLRPSLCAPYRPCTGRSLVPAREGRAVRWRHPGTRPAVRLPSAMTGTARGSGRWPPLGLLLRFAALLGTLGPQVRRGDGPGVSKVGGWGAGGWGASQQQGSLAPLHRLGSPQIGTWPALGSCRLPSRTPAGEKCQRGKAPALEHQAAEAAWGRR